MATIVSSQSELPSSKQPSETAINEAVPESNYESDDWEAPTLEQILARQKPKTARPLIHSNDACVSENDISSGCFAKISPINNGVPTENTVGSRNLSLGPGSSKGDPIELCLESDPLGFSESQDYLARGEIHRIAATSNIMPKSSYTFVQEEQRNSVSACSRGNLRHCLNKVHGYSAADDGIRNSSLGYDGSPGIRHLRDGISTSEDDRDQQKRSIAAGNAHDIFAEYEEIFGTSKRNRQGRKKERGDKQGGAGDVSPRPVTLQAAKRRVNSPRSTTARAASAILENL